MQLLHGISALISYIPLHKSIYFLIQLRPLTKMFQSALLDRSRNYEGYKQCGGIPFIHILLPGLPTH